MPGYSLDKTLTYLLKISSRQWDIFDLAEINEAIKISIIYLQVNGAFLIVESVNWQQIWATWGLPNSDMESCVSHTTRIWVWKCEVANVRLVFFLQASIFWVNSLKNMINVIEPSLTHLRPAAHNGIKLSIKFMVSNVKMSRVLKMYSRK